MNAFLRALGFRSHNEDDDTLADYPSALPIQSSIRPADDHTDDPAAHADGSTAEAAEPTAAEAASPSDQLAEQPEEPQPAFPITIFDSLLEVFNEAQPDFIRKCLDMDAQRRYLYERVDESFRSYIQQIKDDVRRRAYNERNLECRRMTQEIDRLREQLQDRNKVADDYKALRASADRQKRTFNDRIHDLEQQLAAALASKEQSELEVKSLANKLKVQQYQQADQTDPKELDDIRQRLAAADRQITAMNSANAMHEAELKRNKNRLVEVEATMKAAEERAVAAEKRCRELQSRLDNAEMLLRQAEEKMEQAKPVAEPAEAAPPFDALPAVEQIASPAAAQSPTPPAASLVADAPTKKYRPRSRKTTPRISAIDESMDSTEWLVATPPEGMMKPDPGADSDFGYQEPPRKPRSPESDAQMSLF